MKVSTLIGAVTLLAMLIGGGAWLGSLETRVKTACELVPKVERLTRSVDSLLIVLRVRESH